MNPKTKTSRRRAVATAAILTALGAGLVAAPLLIDATSSEISVQAAAVIAATRDSYTLTSPVALPLLPNFMIDSGRLSVALADANHSGAAILALLSGGKARLVLDDAVLSFTPSPAAGASDGVPGPGLLAPVLEALLKLSFSKLELRQSAVHIKRASGAVHVLTDVVFDVSQSRSGEAHAVGSFAYRGRKLDVDLKVGKDSGASVSLTDGTKVSGRPLKVTMTGDLVKLSADGVIAPVGAPQFNGSSAEITIGDVRELARWLGVDWAAGPGLKKFEAKGPLEWSSRGLTFPDATFKLDGNEATGTLGLKLAETRPAFDGTLAFKAFDVAPYVRSGAGREDAISFDFADYLVRRRYKDGPLPLLDQLDADLRISAAKVTSGAMAFGKGAASLSLRNGVLLADLAELEIGSGGRCGGQLGIDVGSGTPRYTLRGKFEAIELAMLAQAFWSYGVVSGNGSVVVDLVASGSTPAEIVASIKGKASIVQPSAGQIGLDLRTLAATARAQPQKGWAGATRGQTPIDGLNAQFTIDEGLLSAATVVAKAGDATLHAEGTVDLPTKAGNLKLWITHPNAPMPEAKPANGGTPPASAAVTGAAAPDVRVEPAAGPGGGLHVLGPLEAPEIRFVPLAERVPPGRG